MRIIGLATGALALTIGSAASAQNVGDWVLSPWRNSTMEFPGVVAARDGNSVTIQFDDGDVETRHVSDVRPYDWRPGSRISCRWSDGNWYNATILSMGGDGYGLRIRYDADGVVENTQTGRCRTRG